MDEPALLVDQEPFALTSPAPSQAARPKRTPRARSKKYPGAIYIADAKDDIASMEHPLFALQAGDKRVRVYERNGARVTIMPGSDGCATIHDKDLWLYCISLLTARLNDRLSISPTLKFTAYAFMKATNRDTSGRAYERMGEMLRRLKGTVIETNIETNRKRTRAGFGLIESWQVLERDDSERMVAVEVTLPQWLFRSIESKAVLTISPKYFDLRKPLARRLYELARKHCGKQRSWSVSMAVLHEKSGSTRPLKSFRSEVRKLVESDSLPDYRVTCDAADMVTFRRISQIEVFDLLTAGAEAVTPPDAAS